MRALVLGGAGAVCKETTRDLVLTSSFEEIVVADHQEAAARHLVDALGDKRLKALYFDADNYQAMLELFTGFDIVVNGLPFKYDYPVNKACVEVGVNGLDLSSDDPQFALHADALGKDMIFIPGLGATPGITNMMVRRAAEFLDRMDEVAIHFAAFRCLAPAPGLLQTTLWEFNPEEEDRNEVFYADGAWHPSPPLSGGLAVRFHEQIGEQIVYFVPHDEVYTLPRSYPTLRRVAVRGCFPPHVMDMMQALMRGDFLTSRPVRIGEQELPVIEVTRRLLSGGTFAKQNPVWAYGLVVEVRGLREVRQVTCVYRSHHPPQDEWGGEAAYFKNVGIPLSIGAQLIASSQVSARGVCPPEFALPTAPFFDALAQRGITVEETIHETGLVAGDRVDR